jgi:hypothetical protein
VSATPLICPFPGIRPLPCPLPSRLKCASASTCVAGFHVLLLVGVPLVELLQMLARFVLASCFRAVCNSHEWVHSLACAARSTTLAGDDTESNVKRLCFKAKNAVQQDIMKDLELEDLKITTGCAVAVPLPLPLCSFLSATTKGAGGVCWDQLTQPWPTAWWPALARPPSAHPWQCNSCLSTCSSVDVRQAVYVCVCVCV